MKKIVKILLNGVVVVACSVLCLSLYSNWLDSEIAGLYDEKEDTLSCLGSAVKSKGNVWINETTKNDSLIIMGSSELSAPVNQNIKYNFPNTEYEGTTSCVGHAYVQNNLHAMNLGANYDSFKDSDIVIIESMQWFFDGDIDPSGYMSNFSELQFYEFLQNDLISQKNKEYLCNRFLEIESKRTTLRTVDEVTELAAGNDVLNAFGLTSKFAQHGMLKMENTGYDFLQTHILAKTYASNNIVGKAAYQLMRPYYYIRYQLMRLKDRYETYIELKNASNEIKKQVFNTDWNDQLEQAEEDGKAACNNNDIFVYDDYYTQYLEANWDGAKNSSAGTTALLSKEWEDYKFFLSVCNDLGIKPYIINVSCNAFYYDYIGLDPEMRMEYYKKLSTTAESYEISIYDGLVEREYEPYIYADVMHLGWKGWIYVTKAITNHFNGIESDEKIEETNPALISSGESMESAVENLKDTSESVNGDINVAMVSDQGIEKLTVPNLVPDARYAYAIIEGSVYDLHRGMGGSFYSDMKDGDKIKESAAVTLYFVTYDGSSYYVDTILNRGH